MQSDNKHTDKKLQELENLSLPDLSKMDEHWQQMRTMLQPGSMPSKSKTASVKKLFRLMVAAVLVVGLAFVVYKYIYRKETNRQQASGAINQPAVINVIKDSPVLKFDHNLTIKDSPVLQFNHPKVPKFKQPSSTAPVILKGTTTVKKDTVVLLNTVPVDQSKVALEKFFKELEKEAQQFVINNKRDTILNGKEGSTLLIPAYTFGNHDKVVVTMKEFYSYADIIANKLSTTSGNEQLETGGMLHLAASVDGKEVNMSPGGKIRWFLEDTTSKMEGMQLFTSTPSVSFETKRVYDTRDTIAFASNVNVINWQQQNQSFRNNFINTTVKVLDLRDLPYKVLTNKGKYRGFFAMNKESALSKEELIAALHKKYKYYDKIMIRKGAKNKTWQTFIGTQEEVTLYSIGDSTWLPLWEANMYKLPSSDTLITRNNLSTENNTLNPREFKKLASRYGVDISSLGWINCDRFYNDNRSKIDYIVNLNDNASNYYTVLIFDRFKSMMPGYAAGNKVVFSNVPNGESVKIVSIGIKDDKAVSAMAPSLLSKSTFTGLKFEETTPAAFKEDVKTLDK